MSPDRRQILFLASDLPYPPASGMTIRAYHFLAGLSARHDVHLLCFASGADIPARVEALRDVCASAQAVGVPVRSRLSRTVSLLRSPLPDMAMRARAPAFDALVDAILLARRFDLVHIESIEMAPYGLRILRRRRGSAPRVVLDELNAEYTLQRLAFETDVRSPTRWVGAAYSWVQWRRLAWYEKHICGQVDQVVAVSDSDRDALLALAPETRIAVVPNGVDLAHYQCYRPDSSSPLVPAGVPTLVFTGKMDFRPNVDAVIWFCDEVLPRIRSAVPDVQFYIVGQSPLRPVTSLGRVPGVHVTGWVPDVRPYLAAAHLAVVPMRMGGGTRLKVLEAMAMGVPVLSTRLGCEGYGLVDGTHVAVGDSAVELAERAVQLLSDAGARSTLGKRAREYVSARYDWQRIVPLLGEAYDL